MGGHRDLCMCKIVCTQSWILLLHILKTGMWMSAVLHGQRPQPFWDAGYWVPICRWQALATKACQSWFPEPAKENWRLSCKYHTYFLWNAFQKTQCDDAKLSCWQVIQWNSFDIGWVPDLVKICKMSYLKRNVPVRHYLLIQQGSLCFLKKLSLCGIKCQPPEHTSLAGLGNQDLPDLLFWPDPAKQGWLECIQTGWDCTLIWNAKTNESSCIYITSCIEMFLFF